MLIQKTKSNCTLYTRDMPQQSDTVRLEIQRDKNVRGQMQKREQDWERWRDIKTSKADEALNSSEDGDFSRAKPQVGPSILIKSLITK